jgi:hypothetical protein
MSGINGVRSGSRGRKAENTANNQYKNNFIHDFSCFKNLAYFSIKRFWIKYIKID